MDEGFARVDNSRKAESMMWSLFWLIDNEWHHNQNGEK